MIRLQSLRSSSCEDEMCCTRQGRPTPLTAALQCACSESHGERCWHSEAGDGLGWGQEGAAPAEGGHLWVAEAGVPCLPFQWCGKSLWDFKGGKSYCGSRVWRFHLMVDCLHCFGSEMREAPTVEKCSLHDKWVAMRRRGRRVEHNVPHARWPPFSNSPYDPNFPHPPNDVMKLWISQWINSLIRSQPSVSNHVSAEEQDFKTWTISWTL